MDDLELEIKRLIIGALNLEDMTEDDIETNAPLFGEGLGLDSIDALELGVAIKNHFGVKLSSTDEKIREHFASVHALAEYITRARGEEHA